MKRSWIPTAGMIVKILIILVLPLLLFRYVESQPAVNVADESKQETRSVAIVNEDNGLDLEEEPIELGSDIPSLLREQEDYSWIVVDRSTAEKGFSNKKYDAIMYIPSDFSLNVMTFKENKPTKASINYVIQPNLDAKNRQRVHKEMAIAKNQINEKMSKIYWDYVAQEVNYIQDNFDKILEKEMSFQDAMYSFYAPSSKTLAGDIEQQRNQLQNLLKQTNSISDVSLDSVDTAEESSKTIAAFSDSLNDYQQLQMTQRMLLGEFQQENHEALSNGITAYDEALDNAVQAIDEQIKAYDSLAYKQDENTKKIQEDLEFISFELQNGREAIMGKDSNAELANAMDGKIFKMNRTLLLKYNRTMLNDSYSRLKSAASTIKGPDHNEEAPLEPEFPEIEMPDSDVETQLLTLKENVKTLHNAFDQIKPAQEAKQNEQEAESSQDPNASTEVTSSEENENMNDGNWKQVEHSLADLNQVISGLEKDAEKQKTSDFDAYVKNVKDAYRKLQNVQDNFSNLIVQRILQKQGEINENIPTYNEYEQLGDLPDRIKDVFLTWNQLQTQDADALAAYAESLADTKQKLDKSSIQFKESLANLLEDKEINAIKKDILATNKDQAEQMENMFVKLLGEDDESENGDEEASIGKVAEVELSFDTLVLETNEFLEKYEGQIDEQFEQIMTDLSGMENAALEVSTQLQSVNANRFEWEESPSGSELNGQLVLQMQQNALTSLGNISNMVDSLGERQGAITSATDELQDKINSVQSRSNELNEKWSQNVTVTEQVNEDVHDVLANTFVDGQKNPFVYNYLANPVNVEGKTKGHVLTEKVEPIPPVVLFLIILVSGLLIGFITHYYAKGGYLIQSGLFLLLNLAVGIIISIYSLRLYDLQDVQTIRWVVLTVLLLMACSNLIRGGLFVHTFVGWLASIFLIVFFVTPLIDIAVPEFGVSNPIANVYMGIQFGTQVPFVMTIVVLALIVLVISALIYSGQYLTNAQKADDDEEKAS